MASNPMQRKVRNAFLGGFLIALIIGIAVAGYFYLELDKEKKKSVVEKQTNTADVYVVTSKVASGGTLKGNIEYQSITTDVVPENAATLYDLALYTTEAGVSNFSIGNSLDDRAISKIALEPGTILTTDMLAHDDDGVYRFNYKEENGEKKLASIEKNPSVRLEEYNMIVLPTKLKAGDYIDIRLQLPTGETFIVASKKYVEDADQTSIWLKVSEEEILTINNAIVEAYTMKGAKLYANVYVEAGVQSKADVTYVPSAAVLQLIDGDSNIIATAKQYLSDRYTSSMRAQRNDVIDYNLKLYDEDRLKNTEDGIATEIENLQNSRQKYLDQLSAY